MSQESGSLLWDDSPSLASLRGPRLEVAVLVFCSEDDLRNSIIFVLQLMGCQRVRSHSAPQPFVLEALRHDPVDLVLCDLQFSTAVLSVVKGADDSSKDRRPRPVLVLISGKRFDRQMMSAALEQGASSYITKPVRVQSIRSVIKRYFSAGDQPVDEDITFNGISECGLPPGYERVRDIGQGAFGMVTLCRRNKDMKLYAVKKVPLGKFGQYDQGRVLNELRLHKSFDCPCIVRSFHTWLSHDVACILMQYVEAGTLTEVVTKCRDGGTKLDNALIIGWFGQMLIGIMYLHEKAVIHRDLKLDNVLGPNAEDCVFLADFGISKQMTGQEATEMSVVGTPRNMAPERLNGNSVTGLPVYGVESDMWSLGVILYELAALRAPFRSKDKSSDLSSEIYAQIGSEDPAPLPFTCSDVLHKVVVGGLLQKRPEDRPSAAELCMHPTIGGAIFAFLKRRRLLRHPSVLELIDILPAPDNPDQVEVSVVQGDITAMNQQGELGMRTLSDGSVGGDSQRSIDRPSTLRGDGEVKVTRKSSKVGFAVSDDEIKSRSRYGKKLLGRSMSNTSNASRLTTVTEKEFRAFESAEDEVVRTTSLNSIKARGNREFWTLQPKAVRVITSDVLGNGSFGVVRRGELYGAPVALKAPHSREKLKGVNSLSNELRVLRNVWHPNVVMFFGACIDPSSASIILVLELLHGMKLGNFVMGESSVGVPRDGMRWKLLLDICNALCYLHSRRPCVVHGDLKDSNLMVELWDSGLRLKLLDFGLSRICSKHAAPLGGTLNWMAPELIKDHTVKPSACADVFSYGRLLFFVVTGKRPLSNLTVGDIIKFADRGLVPPLHWPSLVQAPLGGEAAPLVDRCLSYTAMVRPCMDEVKETIMEWKVDRIVDPASGEGEITDWDSGMDHVQAILTNADEKYSDPSPKRRVLGIAVPEAPKLLGRGCAEQFVEDVMESLMSIAASNRSLIETGRVELYVTDRVITGRYGAVVVGQFDGYMVAVRVPRVEICGLRPQNIERMLPMHFNVRHPNIVAFHGVCFDRNMVCPVFEWIYGPPLEAFLQVSAPEVRTRHTFLLDLCSALCYLHDKDPPIVHGCLRASNIVVETVLERPRIKLLDFGVLRLLLGDQAHQKGAVGSSGPEWQVRSRRRELIWSAPELLNQDRPLATPAADVFSFGRLAFLVLTGRLPLQGHKIAALEQAAKKNHVLPLKWNLDSPLSKPCTVLSDRCCRPKPKLRPDIMDVAAEVKTWADAAAGYLKPKTEKTLTETPAFVAYSGDEVWIEI
mmetsp:Transcript_108343/g.305496  ORF Transcript_108343/g.305496 Transcript_108343/m.305496 type:complete len:1275 (+) Transcript_108343:181-4005(+)